MLKIATSSFVLVGALAIVTSAFAQDKRREAATSAAEADEDFAYQGEYHGMTFTPALGCQWTGLQVVALGDAQFQAVQYRGGLPGAGWDRYDKLALTGEREDNVLSLAAEGGAKYSVTVCGQVATLRNAADQIVGRLCKVMRQSPTLGSPPPCGAAVLFDGTGADRFNGGRMTEDGLLMEGPMTKEPVRDFQLHLEFRTPYMPYARGQGRGNSGVYVQQRYEVQILDSFGLEGANNECGGLYRTRAPDVNMCLPPLSWQTYDIYFTAARWNTDGDKTADARLTVFHNGVAIHSDYGIPHKTGAGKQEGPEPLPILLQNHGNPVRFRNIWIVHYDAASWSPEKGSGVFYRNGP